MIEALLLKFGFEGGLKLARPVILALIIGALFAAGGTAFWLGMRSIESMVSEARTAAIAETNAKWKAEIEASNAAVEKARAEAAIASAKVSAEATQTISGLNKALADWEIRNAKTPVGGTPCFSASELSDLNSLRNGGPGAPPDPHRHR